MTTLLQLFSGLAMVIAGSGVILAVIGLPMYHSDLKSSVNIYSSIYSREELADKKNRMQQIRRWGVRIVLALLLVFVLGVIGSFVSSRGLTEHECETNGGVFEVWDSGFQWKCYNPSEIPQSNNIRVILEEGQ